MTLLVLVPLPGFLSLIFTPLQMGSPAGQLPNNCFCLGLPRIDFEGKVGLLPLNFVFPFYYSKLRKYRDM